MSSMSRIVSHRAAQLKRTPIEPTIDHDVTVHWHTAATPFYRTIGVRKGRDGRLQKRKFWLGRDHERALHRPKCLALA